MTDNSHYVTPKKAKEKNCPQRFSFGEGKAYFGECLGPQCMAWRWAQGTNKHWIWAATNLDPEPRENWIPIEEFEVNGRRAGKFREGPTHGYCGMVRHG